MQLPVFKYLSAILCAAFLMGFAQPIAAIAQSSNAGLARMQLSGDEPIAIDADRLEVRESEGIAIFTGAVSVVQGETNMKAGELIVYYAKGDEGSAATGTAAIDRLEMTGKVVLQSPTQTATGDAGSFDMSSETFTLTGSRVVLTEGENVAMGCKLVVQMASGAAKLDACAGSGGRVQIMLNPKSASKN